MANIVFLDEYSLNDADLNGIRALGNYTGYEFTAPEQVLERAANADILIVNKVKLTADIIGNLPKLRLICEAATGVDNIDVQAAAARGIPVKNAKGYSTHSVAEATLGGAIAMLREIVYYDGFVKQGEYSSSPRLFNYDRPTRQLYGRKWGIVGLGAIGQRVALLANAFGCKVLGYNRSPKALPHITQVDKDTLLRQSDIITVHLPLNPETKAFIGTNEFALMQPHAVLINTARGPIVSQEALYNALKKGQIAGAAVDVYDQEPPLPLNLELFNAPNLLMLPHMGYATREAFETRQNIVIRNIEMWLNNTPQNQVL